MLKKDLGGEKRKMKTKIMAILIALVVLVGIGSAALVGFLSNTVEVEVIVDSPMEQWISDGSGWVQTPISASILAGETLTFYVKTKNHANTGITGNSGNIVISPGITCNDLEKVEVRTSSDGGTTWDPTTGYYDLIALGLCSQIDYNTIQFSYGPTPITWSAGQEDKNEIKATFKTDAVGTYVFTSEITP